MNWFAPNIRFRASRLLTPSTRMCLWVGALLLILAAPVLAQDQGGVSREAVVQELALAHNAPNPFNANTTINYRLLADAQVRVDIFDLRGRHVVTLLDEYQPQGERFAVWKTEEDPSGTYIFRLVVDGLEAFGKMSLVK
jgi:hypothetical protein